MHTLQTPRLLLTMLDASHAEAVAAYFKQNREHARRWNPASNGEFFTAAFQAERLTSDQVEQQAGRAARFWMVEAGDDARQRVIGHIALSNIVRGALQGCHLGYMIDAQFQGSGLTTEGCRAVINYSFTTLELHRIEANIMPHNAASIRVIEKLGFEREGLSRQYLRINGVWEDHYRYGLLNSTAS
ncbi:MAG: GNAT family N-acetyltransferase [Roseiflexaceae bacterium]|nr:GNAT family N-acetyltransferase [Roseiflexaceae bacterium]